MAHIERKHVVEMFRRADLYEACPSLAYMREAATADLAAYDKSGIGACCGPNFNLIRGLVDLVTVHVRQWPHDAPERLAFRQAACRLIGAQVQPLYLYYRRGPTGPIGKVRI